MYIIMFEINCLLVFTIGFNTSIYSLDTTILKDTYLKVFLPFLLLIV